MMDASRDIDHKDTATKNEMQRIDHKLDCPIPESRRKRHPRSTEGRPIQ